MCIYLYTYKDLNKLMAKDALLLCLFLSFLVLLSCLLLFFFFYYCVCVYVCMCVRLVHSFHLFDLFFYMHFFFS